MVVPPMVCHRVIDARFADYHEYLILEDVCIVSAPSPWSIIYNCIKWFYKVSYPYLTLVPTEDLPRLAHQEMLEEEHTGGTLSEKLT